MTPEAWSCQEMKPASKGRRGITAPCTRTADPVLLASLHLTCRGWPLYLLTSSLELSLGLTVSATIGPCCSSNSQGHSCLRNFALAVLSAWCSLFPNYQQGLRLHLLQVFTQMTPLQWCLLSYLRLQSSYIHIYKGRNSILFITVSCASKSTWHKVKCAMDICRMNVWITVHLILLLIFALKSNKTNDMFVKRWAFVTF